MSDEQSAVQRCLCQDVMPSTEQLQRRADAPSTSSAVDVMAALKAWWDDVVVTLGADPAMSPKNYRRIVAR